ncbi:uncharacterized protein LOC123880952 [Maniola jurtina]|uniref:uncharacterized protein LOC123876087 n=1 Tax=Maniola jurtina TaxID=191418 RepID=UPI001E68A65B|nr:uncharacterized protein LOC123876087 [Maniola jurtina]XP_045779236.1 uncharacterized protein LOC123876880 [Maniola jurtina]XP_045781925.1 uncharacterized protein LOC123878656 [Maniola jurtina]XP_045785352.1 uncharacterized protein LOC123880952 [Maniola jurtina]
MAWDKEKTLLFIEKYREIRELWDPKHPQHFNKIIKQDGWVKLSDQFGITVEECQKKITSLLASLRREKSKMKKSASGTGKGAEEVYTSTWFAYAALSFILDRYEPRKTTDSIPCEPGTQDLQETRDKPPENPDAPQRKKAKVDGSDDIMHSTFQILQDFTSAKSDECTTFGKFITEKLKTYSHNTRACVQHHISNILFSADRGEYEYMYQQHGYWTPDSQLSRNESNHAGPSGLQSTPSPAAVPSTADAQLSSPEASINSQESEGFMREFGDLID